jgi:putative tricarboxylic transport membrane protein
MRGLGRRATAPADRARAPWPTLAANLAAPAMLLLAGLLLPLHVFESEPALRGDGPGPGAWPSVMLAAIAVFAGVWMVQEVLAWRRGHDVIDAGDALPEPEREHYHYAKAVAGLAMILAYGWLLPVLGFAVATTVFILVWCVIGGMRNVAALVLVPVVGTVALLWLFMGLALMPLSRGRGVFDQISIAVLQTLGIY